MEKGEEEENDIPPVSGRDYSSVGFLLTEWAQNGSVLIYYKQHSQTQLLSKHYIFQLES